jgi:hypothetical protein
MTRGRSLLDRFPDIHLLMDKWKKEQEFLKKEALELSIDDFVEKYNEELLPLWWRTNKIKENK